MLLTFFPVSESHMLPGSPRRQALFCSNLMLTAPERHKKQKQLMRHWSVEKGSNLCQCTCERGRSCAHICSRSLSATSTVSHHHRTDSHRRLTTVVPHSGSEHRLVSPQKSALCCLQRRKSYSIEIGIAWFRRNMFQSFSFRRCC